MLKMFMEQCNGNIAVAIWEFIKILATAVLMAIGLYIMTLSILLIGG